MSTAKTVKLSPLRTEDTEVFDFLFGRKKIQRLTFDRDLESEYALQSSHLQHFLDMQHIMLTMGSPQVEFRSEEEKWRYLSFILGAADRLSRTIDDDDKAHIWFAGLGIPQAYALFKNQEKAIDAVLTYGDQSKPMHFNAGKSGWDAMGIYMEKLAKESEEDKKALEHSSLMLTKVVRGY